MTNYQKKLHEISVRITEISDDLKALESLTHDIPSTLNKTRFIVEKILYGLCKKFNISWGKGEPTLENMSGPLVSKKIIPKNANLHLRAIQNYTSPGSHYQSSQLSQSHVKIALDAFVEFLTWYYNEFGPTPVPPNKTNSKSLQLNIVFLLIIVFLIIISIFVLTDVENVFIKDKSITKPTNPVNEFTDTRDMRKYKIIKVGNQIWMAENLKYATAGGCWCYESKLQNCNKYGRLYSWEAATKACPSGWQLPSDDDWKKLEESIGMSHSEVADIGWRNSGSIGVAIKSDSEWKSAGNGNGESGFEALPAGMRSSDGQFLYLNENAFFWTTTKSGSGYLRRMLDSSKDGIGRFEASKNTGLSVRCIKD